MPKFASEEEKLLKEANYQKVTLELEIAADYKGYLTALAKLLRYKNLEDYLISQLYAVMNKTIDDPATRHAEFDRALQKWNVTYTPHDANKEKPTVIQG